MYKNPSLIAAICLVLLLSGCAATMQVDTVSFAPPTSLPNCKAIEGLDIALMPIDTLEKSKEIFGTDLKAANVLPIHLIVHNRGTKEFEINHTQIFGVTADGQFTVAYTLNRAAERIRGSSIGTTAVTRTVAGAVLGAAVGAGIGAGVGHAAGDSSTGAQAGAIIGGTTGLTTGLEAGLSDSFTLEFKKQLATLAFEDRVVFPGDIQQGFIYVKWQPYISIRVKVFNISDNKFYELQFPVTVER